MLPLTITYLDYFGTIVFAITGCLVAAKKQSDILAFILLGIATAVGGGTIRDILIGRLPVFWVNHPVYIIICILVAVMMFTGLHHLKRIRHYDFYLVWADAVGLATFTIIGTHIAINAEIQIVPALLLGVMTACFGSVVRDILSGEPTLIMRNDIYMTASLLGAITYSAMNALNMDQWAVFGGFSACFVTRGLGIHYGLKLPGHRYFENQ